MSDRNIILTNKDAIQPTYRCEHEPYEFYRYAITQRNQKNQLLVAIYEIPPRKANYPYHYHAVNDEVFYIISGNGMLRTPDGDKPISSGDIIVCPPSSSGAHKIINSSETKMLVYLDCDAALSSEVVCYPDSDKVGMVVDGQMKFYKKNTDVDYYEGE